MFLCEQWKSKKKGVIVEHLPSHLKRNEAYRWRYSNDFSSFFFSHFPKSSCTYSPLDVARPYSLSHTHVLPVCFCSIFFPWISTYFFLYAYCRCRSSMCARVWNERKLFIDLKNNINKIIYIILLLLLFYYEFSVCQIRWQFIIYAFNIHSHARPAFYCFCFVLVPLCSIGSHISKILPIVNSF